MLWEDMLLARHPSDDELVRGMASTFGAPLAAVAIVEDVEAFPPLRDRRMRIVLERWPLAGQFPLQVRIHLREDPPHPAIAARDVSMQYVRRAAAALGCDCLVSDEDVSPTGMLLVRPNGEIIPVVLDGDALDRDEHVIASMPVSPG